MKTKLLTITMAFLGLVACNKQELIPSSPTPDDGVEGDYMIEITTDGKDTKSSPSTVELNLANLSYASSKSITAQLKKKSGGSWINVDSGVSYSWSASSADNQKFSGSGTSGQTCNVSAKAAGSGSITVSANLSGSTVATQAVPVNVTDSRALSWTNATTSLTAGEVKTAVLNSNFSGTVTVSSDNSSFLVGTSENSLNATTSVTFDSNKTKTIYYKYTGSSETTVTIKAKSSFSIESTLTIQIKDINDKTIDICLWDDDGIFEFCCYDKKITQLSANQTSPDALFGNFHGCGELEEMILWGYYLYDFNNSTIYQKYKNDNGIKVTLYTCTDDAVYNGGIVLSECKSSSCANQHMGYQEDCDAIRLSNLEYSLGQLYVGIKISFSDGEEYWVKLDDTEDGGKHLMKTDCYMMGLYNSSKIYTTITTRSGSGQKEKIYIDDRYDVYLILQEYDGKVMLYGPELPLLDETITFTDNFGNKYNIPSGVTLSYVQPYQVGWVSQGDRLWDMAHNYPNTNGEWQCSPNNTYWWYCSPYSFVSKYYVREESDVSITYVRYVLDIDL